VQHPVLIKFVTLGFLRDVSGTFLALMYSNIVVTLKSYSSFSMGGVCNELLADKYVFGAKQCLVTIHPSPITLVTVLTHC
jgi:hypothetical protein